MRRGRLSNDPLPRWWLDWRALMPDVGLAMQWALLLTENSLLFEKAVNKLPVDKRVLKWVARNHQTAFDVVLLGDQVEILDQVLHRKLLRTGTWVQRVGWLPDMVALRRELLEQPWVLGFLTPDTALVDPEGGLYHFTGPAMNIADVS